MKPFGKEKLVVGERRKKATNQDTTKNRPIKFNLPRRHCSRATKREDEKEIFLETIVACRHHHQVLSTFYPHARFFTKRGEEIISPIKRTHEIKQRVCVSIPHRLHSHSRVLLDCFARRSGEHKKKDLELGDVERRRLER